MKGRIDVTGGPDYHLEFDADEIHFRNPALVHLERMDDDAYCLIGSDPHFLAYLVVKRRWFRKPLLWINIIEGQGANR